jgi:transcriptional regulator with XRE-family HTH domain
MTAQHEEQPEMITTPVGRVERRSLTAWRQVRNLTQADLATRAGINLYTISNLERAKAVPTLASAARLAQALDVLIEQVRWPSEETVARVASKRNRYAKRLAEAQS